MTPIRILSRFESTLLALPFLMYAVCLAFWIRGGSLNSMETGVIAFARFYLFMGATHVFFTFFMAAALPEVRSVVKGLWFQRSPWIYLAIFLAVTVPVAKWLERSGYEYWRNIFFLFPTYLWARHTIGQMMGLSMFYNQRGGARPQAYGREKLFAKIFIGLAVVAGFFTFYARDKFPAVTYTLVIVNAGVGLLYILNVHRDFPGRVWRNKRIYVWRIFLVPLSLINPVALGATAAVHGTEYFLLCIDMTRKSKSKRALLFSLCLPFIALIAIPILLPLKTPDFAARFFGVSETPILISFIYLGVTLDYLHFYIDGVLFRRGIAGVSEQMSPLIA